jgi:hypothetical protein
MDIATTLAAALVGRHLNRVKRREHDWAFTFDGASGSGLAASCPWRIIVGERIAFANGDDGQKFGLPEPLDGEHEAQHLLGQKAVERIAIRSDTGDLSITFAGSTVLEVLNMSSGYEGWSVEVGGMSVIATGGGELVCFEDRDHIKLDL